jgi:hypothetical protein
MLWLRNDEADRLRSESVSPATWPLSPFPKFDNSIVVPGRSYEQLARDDLFLLAGHKNRRKMSDENFLPLERERQGNTCDELFLPPERKSHSKRKTSQHLAGRLAYGHLNPAQRLPRTRKRIYGLPACLISGPHPSRTFQTSPAGSKSLDQVPQSLGGRLRPPKEIHKTETLQGGTSDLQYGRANLTPSKPQKGRQRSSAQTFGPVQFAQVPSHHDFCRRADNQDLQACTPLSSEIPPLRVLSPLRFSGIFPAPPASSSSPEEIPQSLRVGLHPQKEIHTTVKLQSKMSSSFDEGADLKSSKRQKCQRCLAEKFDPVQFAPFPSYHDFCGQNNNQDLQANKFLSPKIPPLRAVSPFRFSGIFPASPGSLGATSHSLQTGLHPPKKTPKIRASRAECLRSLDGSNDVTLHRVQTHASSGRSQPGLTSNIPSHDAFHKRIRRRKSYENLRMASTSHTILLLPVLSPLVFPDFSFDM